MRIVKGISKEKQMLHSLWIASHFRVVPYFSMKYVYYYLLFLFMLLSLLFLLTLLLLLLNTVTGFKIAACSLTTQRLFTEEIENVMVWSANWNWSRCNVVVNISYQTPKKRFKNFWETF